MAVKRSAHRDIHGSGRSSKEGWQAWPARSVGGAEPLAAEGQVITLMGSFLGIVIVRR